MLNGFLSSRQTGLQAEASLLLKISPQVVWPLGVCKSGLPDLRQFSTRRCLFAHGRLRRVTGNSVAKQVYPKAIAAWPLLQDHALDFPKACFSIQFWCSTGAAGCVTNSFVLNETMRKFTTSHKFTILHGRKGRVPDLHLAHCRR